MTRKLLTLNFDLKPNEKRHYYFSESFGSIPCFMASGPVAFWNVSEMGFDIVNCLDEPLSVEVKVSNKPLMWIEWTHHKKAEQK